MFKNEPKSWEILEATKDIFYDDKKLFLTKMLGFYKDFFYIIIYYKNASRIM